MKGQFIIVNRKTGQILMQGQGVYAWRSGAQKGLAYWGDRVGNREDFEIIELRPELLLALNMKELLHTKSEVRYDTVLEATHSETLEQMTVYQSQKDNKVWVRPTSMFSEDVEVNGWITKRFIEV